VTLYAGDIGSTITVTITEDGVVKDISDASTKTFKIRRAHGLLSSKTASFLTDGTEGKLTWTTSSLDVLSSGHHWLQVYLVTPGWSGHTAMHRFTVEPPLA